MGEQSEAQLLADVVRRVEPADVARRMVDRFRAEIAGYRRLPEPVVMGQIFEICRENVELFFRSILEAKGPTDAELSPFRESAKDRAGEGMPLEDLLHAYRLGGRMGWQAITDEARPEERPALLMGAERLMDYVDRVSAVVAQAYLDERQHLVSEEERRLRELFDGLVGGEPLSPGLRELAERLGFPLAESYRPFAGTLPGAGGLRARRRGGPPARPRPAGADRGRPGERAGARGLDEQSRRGRRARGGRASRPRAPSWPTRSTS